jgi:hypothetical protein
MSTNIINIIAAKLSKYPEIKVVTTTNHSIEIDSHNDTGLPILVEQGEAENTIYLKAFHLHFEKNEDENESLLDLIYCALKGLARVKEISRNGKIYKSILQIKNEKGEWEDSGATVLLSVNIKSIFFNKTRIKYFQNSFLIP